jgi:hypothetical protein
MRCTCLWRHYAHARAVWCSWCMLERPGYPYDELVIARAIIGREGICVVSRILTIKIPSALLVAVMWLQHTRCSRFRRGTNGYGTSTSPKRDIGYEYGVFMRMHVSIPTIPNAYAMQCMPKSGINFNSKGREQGQKDISSGLRNRLDLDWHKLFDRGWDSLQNFGLITTSINKALRTLLLKDVQPRRYIDEGFRNYQQRLGLQCKLAAQRSS